MSQKLEGKSAVVTGSGRGIGRGIALALAGEGAKVVVNDIFREADGASVADKVVEQIKKANGIAIANYDSVATMAGGENVIKTAMSNFGRVDILVNCVGNYVAMPSIETTEEVWDSIMAVNLKGHFSCTKAAALEMIKQKSGRIVNFTSRAAFGGGSLAYAAAKAGIMGFTQQLAEQLGKYGITVNGILPSAITQLFPGERHLRGDGIPVPLRSEPDFIAPMVVYLATDEARSINGRFFYAGGGDIVIYGKPGQLGSADRFIRKVGKWTVDELAELIPALIAAG